MKKSILLGGLFGLLAAVMNSGCQTPQEASTHNDLDCIDSLSWSAFCRCRGHKLNDYSDKVLDEYADAWMGTADEERSLDSLGVIRWP